MDLKMLGIEETQEIAREILRAWFLCVCVCERTRSMAEKKSQHEGKWPVWGEVNGGKGVIYMNQDALLRARKPCFIFRDWWIFSNSLL